MKSLSGVFPVPYVHLCTLVFVSAAISLFDPVVLNCFDFVFVAAGWGSATIYFEKSFVCFYLGTYFSYFGADFDVWELDFFGGITMLL